MGKATIVSGGADGNYRVKLDSGQATKAARLAAMDKRLEALADLLAKALEDLNFAEYDEAQAIAAVESATEAYVAAAKIGLKELEAAAKVHSAALAVLNEKKLKTAPYLLTWQTLKNEDAQLKKEKKKWEDLVVEETVQAWCADLTEDATGVVATVEIPGESKLVLIAPTAPAHTPGDGVLTSREVQSPEQVFFNAAILPGWQKFSPTYRRGTVTSIDYAADTVDVLLEDTDKSSAQRLVINPTPTLSAVPVQYMTCNATAYEVGDRCVVRFVDRDWSKPIVVGFVDNPKTCDPVSDLHLVFWDTAAAGTPIQIVRSAGQGGVNAHGPLSKPASVYRTIGLSVRNGQVKAGITLEDTRDNSYPRISYRIYSFYDEKPVLLRLDVATAYSSSIGPNPDPVGADREEETRITTTTTRRRVTFGDVVLADGTLQEVRTVTVQIFQPPYVSEPNTPGETKSIRNVASFASWPQTILKYEDNTFDGGLRFYGLPKIIGPWASWSVFLAGVTTGVEETWKPNPDADFEYLQTLPDAVFTKKSLGPPRRQAAAKPLAVLGSIPPRENLLVYRDYTADGIPAAPPERPQPTPLDRHLLDFGYLPIRIDGLHVYAVAKNTAFLWPLAVEGFLDKTAQITVLNYKTGLASSGPAKDIGNPEGGGGPTDMPRWSVFTDRYIYRCENDADGPYFWVYVYNLSMVLVKRITNKPGAAEIGITRVVTPTLTNTSYLIGAMRDEVMCM